MKATDKFIPVISVVIYYGEKDWDGAKSLHDMLAIPKELTHYVTDYKMHLIEAKNNHLLFHNENNQNLFQLLKLLLDTNLSKSQKEEKIIAYHTEHDIDKTVAMTVAGVTNTHFDYRFFEKEDGTMISFWREVREEGEQKGRLEGKLEGRASEIVEMGFEFGLSENDILERLQKKLDISLQTAQEYLAMFGKQTV